MKNCIRRILCLAFCVFLLQCINLTTNAQTTTTVSGNVANLQSGDNIIYLFSYYGSDLNEVGSVKLDENGNFTFQVNLIQNDGIYALGFDPENIAPIVLSNKETDIKVNADFLTLQNGDLEVMNSRENEAYRVLRNEYERLAVSMNDSLSLESQISIVDPFYKRKTNEMEKKRNLIVKEYNKNLIYIKESFPGNYATDVLVNLYIIPQLTARTEFMEAYDNEPAFLHDHFFDYVDFSDTRIFYAPILSEMYIDYLDEYTHHSPDGLKDSVDILLSKSKASNAVHDYTIQFLIDVFTDNGPEELVDYVIDSVDKLAGCDAPLSEATAVRIENIKRLRVGNIAPEIASMSPDGDTITLSSLKGKKTKLIYFWASWCSFCEEENTDLVRIYKKYKSKGFEVYAVALDEDKEEWLSSINKYKLAWINVSDLQGWDSKYVNTYNVSATPTTYLLDKENRIVAKDLIGYELERELESILNYTGPVN
ncbi:MAG: redoxin domain-containing protein [Candidatus Scalindua sp.]|jgi:thiol-disulfide isomerase/thioredoxin|nr:redoxin domain-containing protein [Candidatus Scalindua sp.]